MKFDDSGISVNLNQSQKESSVSEDHTQLTDKLAAALLDEPCNCKEATEYRELLGCVRELGGSATIGDLIQCMKKKQKSATMIEKRLETPVLVSGM
jgi:hypothetical protein